MLRSVFELHSSLEADHSAQRQVYPEIESDEFWTLFDKSCPYSMVHGPGFYNVYQSLAYIRDNKLKGDIVECGCALGGIAIFMRLLLQKWGMEDRTIHLFDTFVGPPVGSKDIIHGGGELHWQVPMENHRQGTEQNIIDVTGSLKGFNIIEGFVESTLPEVELGDLALLRLDTDFYESTKVEFEYLYPKLVKGGVLIVDDYGYFQGSRRATDEYLAKLSPRPLLNRMDMGVWAGVKP